MSPMKARLNGTFLFQDGNEDPRSATVYLSQVLGVNV